MARKMIKRMAVMYIFVIKGQKHMNELSVYTIVKFGI